MSVTNIATHLEPHGVLVAVIDMPGRAMNVFSIEMMDSLEELLDQVGSRDEIRGVVLMSAKKAFLAGADLHMIRQYIDAAQGASMGALHRMCGRLGRLFRRLETNGKPFVAAVHGLALGGGLELALACHGRILSNSPTTKVGLPEIKLGLLPGAGGTQRLPRLLGPKAAFAMLLGGEPLSAQDAFDCALVHEVVDEVHLRATAIRYVHQLALSGAVAPWDTDGWQPPTSEYHFAGSSFLADIARDAGITDEDVSRYPAYEAIMRSTAAGWPMSMDDGIRWEMDCFVRLIQNRVAGNMVRTLFLNRQRAGKLLESGPAATRARRLYVDEPIAEPFNLLFDRSGIAVAASPPPAGELVVTQRPGRTAGRTGIAWLRDTDASLDDFGLPCGIYVALPTSLGCAVEYCILEDRIEDRYLDIARWLKAVPFVTAGTCLLQNLAATAQSTSTFDLDERVLAAALTAARVWRSGAVQDLDFADVALVIAGFAPAYTGGLFTYLRQTGLAEVSARAARARARHGDLFEVPHGCAELFQT